MHEMIRIFGIDPGLRFTGWGVIETQGNKLSYLASGVVCPPVKQDLSARLQFIFSEIGTQVEKFKPDCAAIEGSFVSVNAGSAMKLGHARAAAMLAVSNHDLPVAEYAPRTVKQALVGTGGADKNQVANMVGVLLRGVQAKNDEADALALAICHAHHANQLKRVAS